MKGTIDTRQVAEIADLAATGLLRAKSALPTGLRRAVVGCLLERNYKVYEIADLLNVAFNTVERDRRWVRAGLVVTV